MIPTTTPSMRKRWIRWAKRQGVSRPVFYKYGMTLWLLGELWVLCAFFQFATSWLWLPFYWALFPPGVASPASDWLFVGCLPQCKVGSNFYRKHSEVQETQKNKHFKSVDHQKQRLEFTRNFLRFAQAHLSLKLLRLKKSFDLTCSQVVSVWVSLNIEFESSFGFIYVWKWLRFNPH